MASSRMKADEKRAKILRQLIALESNKYCFDCSQRGTTYVNMTIGSYVCTQCSGLLRGLNNPHRVKSVNIATFTNDDMDFLKSRGNDLCRKVWLGLYDRNSSVPEPDPKNSQGLKDFLSMKYDSKRWHVAPTDEMYAEARLTNQPAFDVVERGAHRARGVIPNNNSSKLIIQQPPRSTPSATSSAASLSSLGASTKSASSMQKIDAAAFVASAAAAPPSAAQSGLEVPGRTANLLGDLGADPFGAPISAPASTASTAAPAAPGAFPADFSAAFNSAPSPAASSPWGMTAQPLMPSQPGAGAPLAPSAGPPVSAQPLGPSPAASASASDKYAALAELDGLFGSGPSQAGGGAPSGSVFGGAPAAPAPAPTSVNWSGAPAASSGAGFGMAWSGGSATTAAWNPAGGEPASVFGATSGGGGGGPMFGATSTWSNGNPFGGGAGPAAITAAAPNKMGGAPPSANPFMGNPFAGGAAGSGAAVPATGGGWPGMNHHHPNTAGVQPAAPPAAQPALNGWAGMGGQAMMMGPSSAQPVSHNPFLSLSNQFQSGPGAPPPQSQPFGSGAALSSTNPFL